jgi:RNA polymerase sigma factor (sigma-70 family)
VTPPDRSRGPSERPRLEELYVRYAPDAKRLAFLISNDEDGAEDLMQDAFVRVAGRLAHLRRPDSFWWYLRRTITNLAVSRAGRQRIQSARYRTYAAGQTLEARSVEDATSERSDMLGRVEALPPKQRAVLVLRFYEDMTVSDIARLLNASEGTVRSWLSRGIAALRTGLDGEVNHYG